MTDRIKIDVESDDASAKLKNVAEGLGDVNEELGKNESANTEASKASSNFAATAAKAAVAIAGLKAVLIDTLQAYADQDALNGQLQRSLRRTTKDVGSAAAAFKKAQDTFAGNAKFGVGVAAQTAAYRKLVDSTGDAEQSLNDLKLAVDIQAQADVDLAGATDKLMKARQGDTGALKELGVLTKDQEALLASLTDETERADIAMQFLADAFDGAAEENRGLADDLASNEVELENVRVATGKLVGAIWKGSNSLVNGVLELTGVLPEGNTTLSAFAFGMNKFSDATLEASNELKSFLKEVTAGEIAEMLAANSPLGKLYEALGGETIKFTDVLSREADKQAKVASKLDFTIKDMPDVEGPSAEDRLKLALKRNNVEEKRLKTLKKTKEVIEDTGDFTGDFGEEEESQKEQAKVLAAQQKLDLEIQLQEIKNVRAATNSEYLQAELDLESQLLKIKGASLDPELERLRIAEANLKLSKKKEALNLGKKTKKETDLLEDKAKAEATVGDAINLSAQGAAVAADLFGAGEREKAGISGAMETARAIAAGASGNIAGAVGHGLAAASFFAVAAGAGAGGSGGGGGASAATSVAATGSSFSGSGAEELALAGQSSESRTGTLTITNNYSSVFPPSPEQEREARAATERDARREI